MKVTVIPTVIGPLGTILKGFIKGLQNEKIRGQVDSNYSCVEVGQNT